MTSQSIEAEQAVLGSILVDARCLEEVARVVRPEDFSLDTHRDIYQAILAMDRERRRIDPVTVKQEALRAGIPVDDQYLVTLMDITPTAANAGAYAQIVRERSLGRGVASVAEYITTALSEHTEPQAVLLETARQVESLQKEGINDDLLDPDNAMLAFYAHRERVEKKDGGAYVPTGYQDLDQQLGGGLLNSGLYILAARPGMGKTTLAINIADRVARFGRPVLFVSLEMDPEQIEAKRLSRETSIPSIRLLMGSLSEQEEILIADAADEIRKRPLHFNRRDTVTVAQIEVMARRVPGLTLIVVDYIGKLLPEASARKFSRVEYMTEISGALKNLARRFRVPVLALCQLNRALADRQDKTPVLSDLRDTGAIEQDADGVIFLHRPDYYDFKTQWEVSELQVIVAKNRHGAVGQCEMTFDMVNSKMTTSRSSGPKSGMTWEKVIGK